MCIRDRSKGGLHLAVIQEIGDLLTQHRHALVGGLAELTSSGHLVFLLIRILVSRGHPAASESVIAIFVGQVEAHHRQLVDDFLQRLAAQVPDLHHLLSLIHI